MVTTTITVVDALLLVQPQTPTHEDTISLHCATFWTMLTDLSLGCLATFSLATPPSFLYDHPGTICRCLHDTDSLWESSASRFLRRCPCLLALRSPPFLAFDAAATRCLRYFSFPRPGYGGFCICTGGWQWCIGKVSFFLQIQQQTSSWPDVMNCTGTMQSGSSAAGSWLIFVRVTHWHLLVNSPAFICEGQHDQSREPSFTNKYLLRPATLIVCIAVIARVHSVHMMNADSAPLGRQPSDQASRFALCVHL